MSSAGRNVPAATGVSAGHGGRGSGELAKADRRRRRAWRPPGGQETAPQPGPSTRARQAAVGQPSDRPSDSPSTCGPHQQMRSMSPAHRTSRAEPKPALCKLGFRHQTGRAFARRDRGAGDWAVSPDHRPRCQAAPPGPAQGWRSRERCWLVAAEEGVDRAVRSLVEVVDGVVGEPGPVRALATDAEGEGGLGDRRLGSSWLLPVPVWVESALESKPEPARPSCGIVRLVMV
jgi:hypothetical protein